MTYKEKCHMLYFSMAGNFYILENLNFTFQSNTVHIKEMQQKKIYSFHLMLF
jgi:hypothetical protein